MTIPAPFTQFRYITPLLISVSIALTTALMLLEVGNPIILWLNWATAGCLSLIIWNSISRFNLKGGSDLKAFAITWSTMTAGLQFCYCHFPERDSFFKVAPQLIALMLALSSAMSLWQRRRSTLKCLLLGLIIGLASTAIPHALLWIILFPVAGYYMRCWSSRNAFSMLTGVAFAVWVVYCARFILQSPAVADHMFRSYAVIMGDEDYSTLLQGLGLWQYLFMGISLLMLIIYNISGLLLGAGQSIRASSSIQLISMFSLVYTFLMAFDVCHFLSNFSVLWLFISLQLTIHQANVRSMLHEWWIILIIIAITALCIVPLFI